MYLFNPGGRGVFVEYWDDGTYSDLQAIMDAPPTLDRDHFESTIFCDHEINAKQTRMRGIISPPKSGIYSFQVKSSFSSMLSVDGVSNDFHQIHIFYTLYSVIEQFGIPTVLHVICKCYICMHM